MTRKFDSYSHMLEFTRLQRAEAASESAIDADVRQFAMDAARVDVEYAIWQLRGVKSWHEIVVIMDRVQRSLDALERALASLTVTATVPRE